MNSISAMTKSIADQRLTLPLSAACAPALMADKMAVVLMPPSADTMASRLSELSISRRTSWKKVMASSRFEGEWDGLKHQPNQHIGSAGGCKAVIASGLRPVRTA